MWSVRLGIFISVLFGYGGVQVAGAQQGWQLVWADEFDQGVLDQARWTPELRAADTNNELHYYVPDEVSVANGELVLRSQRRNYQGRDYTSGMVRSRRKFAQTFGRIEVRAKLPGTRGIWPAHWMLPERDVWPPEIDIMELKGHEPHTVYMTHHWGMWPNVQRNGGTFTGPDFTAGYHVFAVEWSPGEIRWFVDGVERFVSRSGGVPYEPFYIILNTAVGGDFVGSPDGTTVFPQHHRIDYVRVYTKSEPDAARMRVVDPSGVGPELDGRVRDGEYVALIGGINAGAGDVIGRLSRLGVESDRHGFLTLGIDSHSAWSDDPDRGVVVYLDTRPGGMTSTISMIDNTFSARALASGRARVTGAKADLFFADGVAAEYALVLQDDRATVYDLDMVFQQQVAAADIDAPSDTGGGQALRYVRSGDEPTQREVRVALSAIGVGFESAVRLVATVHDAGSGDRFDEFVGVGPGGWFDGVGATQGDIQLAAGDFVEFVTSPEFCEADVNLDGDVNTLDVLQFLSWWSAGDDRADFVADGELNTLDLIAYLALWNGDCG